MTQVGRRGRARLLKRETLRLSRTSSHLVRTPSELRHARAWIRSYIDRRSPLELARPWLPFRAQAWLESTLRSDMNVFEFGSGGSTLFIGPRVRSLISVEHDAAWHAAVQEALSARGLSQCTVLLRPPLDAPADPAFRSGKPEYQGLSFESYVAAIDEQPEESLDLVMVDGRVRLTCLRHALPKVRRGGLLVLDNSDRPEFADAFDLLAGHERLDLAGLVPQRTFRSRTTVWTIG